MYDKDLNHSDFKSRQKKGWDQVAQGWKKWWAVLEEGSRPVALKLIELARLKEGHKVLDIATGIGEPALTAAKVVGSSGRVSATDQAPQMLAIAKERAKAFNISNIDFHEMDGENIDFPESSFDAILCRWGLMFLPNPLSCLKKLNKQIKPGGCFSTAVWGEPSEVPMISLAGQVAMKILNIAPPSKKLPSPFSLADTDELKNLALQAGFKDVRVEDVILTYKMPSAQAYAEFTQDISAPIIAMIQDHSPEEQKKVWEAITESIKQYEKKDGSIETKNRAICLVAYK